MITPHFKLSAIALAISSLFVIESAHAQSETTTTNKAQEEQTKKTKEEAKSSDEKGKTLDSTRKTNAQRNATLPSADGSNFLTAYST